MPRSKGRPEKNNVEYFPHPVEHGRKMFIIQEKYRNDGYAVWMKLLEELGKSDYHFIDLNKLGELMYLSSKFMVAENLLMSILNDMAELDAINKDLFVEKQVIFSELFVKKLSPLYDRRQVKCMTLINLRRHLYDNKPINVDIKLISGNGKAQSKVKESKPKKKKKITSSFSYLVCGVLRKRILETRQQKITDKTIEDWTKTVSLMLSRDNRRLEDIEKLINDCHDMPPNPNGFTWSKNILSMQKLREKWNEGKIYLGIGKPEKGSSFIPNKQSAKMPDYNPPEQEELPDEEYMEEVKKNLKKGGLI